MPCQTSMNGWRNVYSMTFHVLAHRALEGKTGWIYGYVPHLEYTIVAVEMEQLTRHRTVTVSRDVSPLQVLGLCTWILSEELRCSSRFLLMGPIKITTKLVIWLIFTHFEVIKMCLIHGIYLSHSLRWDKPHPLGRGHAAVQTDVKLRRDI